MLCPRCNHEMTPELATLHRPCFDPTPPKLRLWWSLVSSVITLVAVAYLLGRQSAAPAVPADRGGSRPASSTPVSRGGERAVGEEWQYLVVEYKPASTTYGGPGLQAWMNGYGREGWEHISGSAYLGRHVFKRRVAKL